jgi:hypothetical protein
MRQDWSRSSVVTNAPRADRALDVLDTMHGDRKTAVPKTARSGAKPARQFTMEVSVNLCVYRHRVLSPSRPGAPPPCPGTYVEARTAAGRRNVVSATRPGAW